MARVRHPAIVSIHDIFFENDDPWIVMEYINGRSLGEIITDANRNGRPLAERTIARIGLPVLRGLCAAHRASVMHRDVKPANILVADDESIFLVDFGIAKIAGDSSLTGIRRLVGTTEFLAPERLRGEEATPAADLWSLGVTLFYALEGYSPFARRGEWAQDATMWAILRDDPPLPVRNGPLADIIRRLLDKNPADRASAQDVSGVLRSVATAGESEPVRALPLTEPMPQSPVDRPKPAKPFPVKSPERSPSRPVEAKQPGLSFEEAREVIQSVNPDTAVAMLLAMPDDQAARILATYPSRVCGDLLEGIVVARSATAGAILRVLRTADAGRVAGYLRSASAAAILAAMPVDEATRILSHAGLRTTAGIIAEMPAEVAAKLVQAMPAKRAAEVLAYVRPAIVAALLHATPDGSNGRLLEHFKPAFRTQVVRFL